EGLFGPGDRMRAMMPAMKPTRMIQRMPDMTLSRLNPSERDGGLRRGRPGVQNDAACVSGRKSFSVQFRALLSRIRRQASRFSKPDAYGPRPSFSPLSAVGADRRSAMSIFGDISAAIFGSAKKAGVQAVSAAPPLAPSAEPGKPMSRTELEALIAKLADEQD